MVKFRSFISLKWFNQTVRPIVPYHTTVEVSFEAEAFHIFNEVLRWLYRWNRYITWERLYHRVIRYCYSSSMKISLVKEWNRNNENLMMLGLHNHNKIHHSDGRYTNSINLMRTSKLITKWLKINNNAKTYTHWMISLWSLKNEDGFDLKLSSITADLIKHYLYSWNLLHLIHHIW